MSTGVATLAPAFTGHELATMRYFEGGAPKLECAGCKADARLEHYIVNGRMTLCPTCKKFYERAKLGSPGKAFLRAILLAIAAGLIGAGISIGLFLLTGRLFGMFAAFIGFTVGKAVCIGSRNRGGWLYELTAVVLTYFFVVLPYVPCIVMPIYMLAQPEAETARARMETDIANRVTGADDDTGIVSGEPGIEPILETARKLADHPVLCVIGAWVLALLIPFIGIPLNWPLWIFIGIGIVAAWKLNMNPSCPISVHGPIRLPPQLQAAS